ncbi:MAG: 50S ribosomal protein L23, partial [Candidatus Daviesbacteria bacterium]|nr:50S ribosomal protein L23 [Candidatus Daviesbacteria bacterium]
MIILKKPIISEKSMKLAQNGLYTFEVDKEANKPLIAKAVAEKFNVKVLKVKIINVKGRIKSQKRVRKIYQ